MKQSPFMLWIRLWSIVKSSKRTGKHCESAVQSYSLLDSLRLPNAHVDLPFSFPHLLFGARARYLSVCAFHGRAALVFSLEFVPSKKKTFCSKQSSCSPFFPKQIKEVCGDHEIKRKQNELFSIQFLQTFSQISTKDTDSQQFLGFPTIPKNSR